MYNLNYDIKEAKRTIYILLAIAIFIGLFHSAIAHAKRKDEPKLVFYVETFRPVNTTPYGPVRIIPKPQKPAVQKTADKRKNKPAAKHESPPANSGRDYGQGEIQDLIRKYAQQYGIKPDSALCIAKKESGFNPNSKNKSSSASGVFQYLSSTWRSTDEGKAGLSVLNAEANIKAAVKYMAIHKSTKPWTVASKCPPVTRIK